MLGPGEWQTFELDAGSYELLQLSLERREYDNATYEHISQDGLGGEMWLSRDTCIAADVYPVEHQGYCPHGGTLVANSSAGIDTQPHPLCSRAANLSYAVDVDAASWVRKLRVAPGAGEVDDLGYGELQGEISDWERKLLAEMHYPKQAADPNPNPNPNPNPSPSPSPNPNPNPNPNPTPNSCASSRPSTSCAHGRRASPSPMPPGSEGGVST